MINNYFFIDLCYKKCYLFNMGMAKKIRILLVKNGNIGEAELSRRLGTTPANFYQKMKRDNFSEKELRDIAAAMGCTLEINFVNPETGEKT